MKTIELTRGQVAIVDDEDYEWLNQWKWFAQYTPHTRTYYAARNTPKGKGKQTVLIMARVICGLKRGNKREVDHKNHKSLDNRKVNLRICSHQENSCNQFAHRFHNGKPCTSQYQGVSWHKQTKKWRTRIRIHGKSIWLGLFTSEIAAAQRYNQAAQKLFGKFACPNKI